MERRSRKERRNIWIVVHGNRGVDLSGTGVRRNGEMASGVCL